MKHPNGAEQFLQVKHEESYDEKHFPIHNTITTILSLPLEKLNHGYGGGGV